MAAKINIYNLTNEALKFLYFIYFNRQNVLPFSKVYLILFFKIIFLKMKWRLDLNFKLVGLVKDENKYYIIIV